MRLSDEEARERAARMETLLARLESADETTRALGTEALEALMDLYGEALARLVGHVAPATLAGDDVIAHVLLLHDLHPVDVVTRVGQALDALRPSLDRQGSVVELVGVSDGEARLRMRGAAQGCSAASLRRTVEDAVRSAAPDLERVAIDVEEPPPALIPVEAVKLNSTARRAPGAVTPA